MVFEESLHNGVTLLIFLIWRAKDIEVEGSIHFHADHISIIQFQVDCRIQYTSCETPHDHIGISCSCEIPA